MSISERILIESALEKDRVSVLQTDQAKYEELFAGPKHAHMCDVCPKSFKKPSDLVRCEGVVEAEWVMYLRCGGRGEEVTHSFYCEK